LYHYTPFAFKKLLANTFLLLFGNPFKLYVLHYILQLKKIKPKLDFSWKETDNMIITVAATI